MLSKIERLAETIVYIAGEDNWEEIGKALHWAVDDGQLSEEDAIILSARYSTLAFNRQFRG